MFKNKNEYIKQLKKLIKIYHPDLCNNSYLESMYGEITKILVNKLNEIKASGNIEDKTNQDYEYYKLGVIYYRNIHPNQFYKRNADSTFQTKTYDELVSALNKIYLSFNLSEYYFNIVINSYKQSPYFEDSKAKVKLLNKLYKSYDNIALEENKIINNDKYINDMGLRIL